MADIDFYRDESEDNPDDAYGFEDGLNDDGDEALSPLQRLQKLLDSDNIFNRQMVARSLLDTLRSIGDNEEDCHTVLKSMVRMSEDGEPSVRSELMEQVPHVVVYCQEKFPGLSSAVPSYILPMVAHLLDDGNDQVRKTSEAALLVLLEQGLVEKKDIEEQVVHVILDHSSNSIFDFVRTEAVALLCKMAPLLGKDITERLFLNRFSEFCIDPLFNVRKVCAANFGEFCEVVGTENTETVLLPKFYHLCEDGVWGVRKACAECFMAVSNACSLEVRRNQLANLFVQLLCDTSRWVRMSAFQQLGPFISTFADPRTTGVFLGEDGTLTFKESLDETESERSMRELERMAVKADEEGSSGDEEQEGRSQRLSPREQRFNRNNSQTPPGSPISHISLQLDPSINTDSTTDPVASPPLEFMEVDNSHPHDPEAELEFVDTISVLQADEGDVSFEERRAEKWLESKGKKQEGQEEGESSGEKMEKAAGEAEGTISNVCDTAGEESSPEGEMTQEAQDKNNSQREPEEHDDQSAEETTAEDVDTELDQGEEEEAVVEDGEEPSEAKEVDGDTAVTTEDAADAENEKSEEGQLESSEDEAEPAKEAEGPPTETMFNSFQFWRAPLPSVDIDLDLIEGSSNAPHVVSRKEGGESDKIFTTEVNLTLGGEGDSSYGFPEIHRANINTLAEEMVTNIGGGSLLEPSLQNVQDMVDLVHIGFADLSTGSLNYMDSDVSPAESEREAFLTDATLAQQQNIVPQTLLESYLGMVDPSRAQTVDTEITRHCAYNLPAVALTLGRQNWHCIKNLYEILAQDIQWKVRRTLAFSIHELAVILGEEITHADLVPVFDSFLRDVDEVRIGVLKHFAEFMKLLHADVRRRYLGRIQDFMSTDNNRYWRFRLELTEQLVLLCDLYTAQDISTYLVSLAITLCLDKIAAVRRTAYRLLSTIIRRMHESGEEVLTTCLTQDLIERFATNEKWLLRQTFAHVCRVILEENALPPLTFAKLMLPALLELGKDKIPNVRLALARTMSQNLLPLEFFTSQHNPHHEELVSTLQGLQTDSDRDVRFFASMPASDTISQSQYQTVSSPEA